MKKLSSHPVFRSSGVLAARKNKAKLDSQRTNIGRVIAAAFLLLAATTAFAGTLTGKVVKVADGDSITVLDNTNTRAAPPATQKRPPQIAPETRSRKRRVARSGQNCRDFKIAGERRYQHSHSFRVRDFLMPCLKRR